MGLFSGRSRKADGADGGQRSARDETIAHFRAFVAAQQGCEAFIEPATRVTQTTMVVVAETGEWTRRRVPDEKAARKLAQELGLAAYDVNLSGYPSRMREWNQKHRKK